VAIRQEDLAMSLKQKSRKLELLAKHLERRLSKICREIDQLEESQREHKDKQDDWLARSCAFCREKQPVRLISLPGSYGRAKNFCSIECAAQWGISRIFGTLKRNTDTPACIECGSSHTMKTDMEVIPIEGTPDRGVVSFVSEWECWICHQRWRVETLTVFDANDNVIQNTETFNRPEQAAAMPRHTD
jgi:hypothetical protein